MKVRCRNYVQKISQFKVNIKIYEAIMGLIILFIKFSFSNQM